MREVLGALAKNSRHVISSPLGEGERLNGVRPIAGRTSIHPLIPTTRFSTCFTPDAAIDYTGAGGIKGSLAEVRAWLAEVMPRFSMTQHLVTNRGIAIDGDEAPCRSCLFNPMGF